MSTIDFDDIPRFHNSHSIRKSVRNPRKLFVMDPSGNFHDHAIEWLQNKYPEGEQTWTIEDLVDLYYDFELQRSEEKVSLHPYVVITAFLNVHRQMSLWSDPARWPEDGSDISLWQDLQHIMWLPLWRKIDQIAGPNLGFRPDPLPELPDIEPTTTSHLAEMTEFGGSDGDQAFCLYAQEVADGTGVSWSNARLLKLKGPGARRAVSISYDERKILYFPAEQGNNGWRPERDLLPMHPNTAEQLKLKLWRRPGATNNITELDHTQFNLDGVNV